MILFDILLGCKDPEKSGPGPDSKSKHDHERGQYVTDFDDFCVVEKKQIFRIDQKLDKKKSP